MAKRTRERAASPTESLLLARVRDQVLQRLCIPAVSLALAGGERCSSAMSLRGADSRCTGAQTTYSFRRGCSQSLRSVVVALPLQVVWMQAVRVQAGK